MDIQLDEELVAQDEVVADGAFARFAIRVRSGRLLDVDAVAGERLAVGAADDSEQDLTDDDGEADGEEGAQHDHVLIGRMRGRDEEF